MRGKHLIVHRIGYSHHGVDVGHGRVIHFAGGILEPGEARIREDSLEGFAAGGEVIVARHADELPPDAVVDRARQHLGRTDYLLVVNNCEHFAMLCVTDRFRSQQVRMGAAVVTGVVRGVAARAAVPVAAAISAVEVGAAAKDLLQGHATMDQFLDRAGHSVISTSGGVGGACAGAAIGTAVLPVVGTLIGAVIGGVAGSTAASGLWERFRPF